jgi:hypothetical protein
MQRVILCLLSGQFEACQMTDTDVLASFDGATLLAAQEAFFGDLTDFFQSRGRLDRAAAVRKQSALMQAAIQQAAAEVQVPTETLASTSGGRGDDAGRRHQRLPRRLRRRRQTACRRLEGRAAQGRLQLRCRARPLDPDGRDRTAAGRGDGAGRL